MRLVRARAPVRICDAGGWTDTWFAGHGTVCSVAVHPGAAVEIAVEAGTDEIRLEAVDFADRYAWRRGEAPGRHPLLEACVDEIPPPSGAALWIAVSSAMPPGCGTGTSAAVCVALLGALDAVSGGSLSAKEVAAAAHRVETERLGLQSGIQDQLAAAHGGINLIEMDAYPHATVAPVPVADHARGALEAGIVLVYLGRPHASSVLHERVIADLEREGGGSVRLEALRRCAVRARDALAAGDLAAYGQALVDNTEAQAALHPDLVGAAARAVIDLAGGHGALGWKVNGAGGDGGSVAVLFEPAEPGRAAFLEGLPAREPACRVLPIVLSPAGLLVREL